MKKPDSVIFKKYLMSLSYDELIPYLKEYEIKQKVKVLDQINAVRQSEMQLKLEGLIPTTQCPECSSTQIVKNGTIHHLQRYKCKKCKTTFTLTTDTFMEGTNWTWEMWVKLLQMTMNTVAVNKMKDTLEHDYGMTGISRNSILLARHKLINAMALMPTPTLSGVIQVDETFFRENQKGTRTDLGKELINVIPNIVEKRLPRRGYSPSRLGVMSSEYCCVVCAVDNNNRAVSVVTSMGRADPQMFTDCFDEHFENVTYLCSDGSPIYTDYCNLKNIPHYVRPSSFVKELRQREYLPGISQKTVLRASQTAEDEIIKELYEKNKKIMAQLYHQGILDYIEMNKDLPFNEFCEIKYKHGLNLSRVNAFHNYLKRFLEKETTGVATKYLPMYVAAYTFMYNWRHAHNTTLYSMKDAETVLIELVKNKSSFTLKDEKDLDFFVAPTPTGRYLALLDKATREMRRRTDNKFFKFDEEDRVLSFDQRKYLRETPVGKLRPYGKKYGIKRYSRMSHWELYSAIMNLPKKTRGEIVYDLIAQDKVFSIYAEDIKFINYYEISEDDLTYSKGSDYVDLERLFIIDNDKLVDLDNADNAEDESEIDENLELPF